MKKLNGNETGKIGKGKPPKHTQFSSTNQPTGAKKSEGKKKKKLLTDLAESLVTGRGLNQAKQINEKLGLGLEDEEMTLSITLSLIMINKIITDGDIRAYDSIMNRISGKVKDKLEVKADAVSVETFLNQFK